MKKKFILLNLIILILTFGLFASCSKGSSSSVEKGDVKFEKTWVTIAVGEEQDLVATTDIQGDIAYTSTNESLVTVSETGKITGVGVGTAEIIATVKEYSAKCFVSVVSSEMALGCGVNFDRAELSLYLGGNDSYQLSATVTNNGVAVENAVTYTSSDSSIITVDDEGNVQAVALGSAYITASTELNGEKASANCKVQVREMLSLSFKTSGDVMVGESLSIETEIRNSDGEIIERDIAWSAMDNTIVSVDEKGTISGNGAGKSQIVADVNGDTFSFDVTVWTPVKTVQDLMALDNSPSNGLFRLANDIEIKVNGIEDVEKGSDASWVMHDTANKRYSLFHTFTANLDGNGHKITLINTTPVTNYEFSGFFYLIDKNAVIKNTVFDIQIAKSEKGGYALCAYAYGTMKDCVVKVKYAGTNANVIRQISNGTVHNVIFDLSNASISKLFNAEVASKNVDNLIVLGQSGYNASNIVNYSSTSKNGALYTSHADAVTANNNGYGMDKKERTTKFDFGNKGVWTFDYTNKEVALCGINVLKENTDYTQISTVADLLALKNGSMGKYVLTSDITLKVNGTDSLKDETDNAVAEGDDAKWMHGYSSGNDNLNVLGDFFGTLDGNGYKITVVNTTSITVNAIFSGLFREVKAGAVIKNTAFDLQYASVANNKDRHMFCGWMEGTIENCAIKVTYQGSNETSFIRGVSGNAASISNVLFDLSGVSVLARNNADTNVSNILVVGATTYGSSVTNGKTFATKAALFASAEKPAFTASVWSFDYENGLISLCGKTVMTA